MTPGPCEPFPLIISEAIAAVTAEDLNIGGSVLSDDTDGEETVSLESADVVTDLPRQPEPEATAGDVVVKLAGQVTGQRVFESAAPARLRLAARCSL